MEKVTQKYMVHMDADAIADCVLAAFDALPSHRKPREASSGLKAGRREWVPLAGIVIETTSGTLKCVALATGMKCLPRDKIEGLNGNVIHDSHAEVLALRAFNRFLLDQSAQLLADPTHDSILQFSPTPVLYPQPFTINPDINIHMYCSEAPCGDASMELTMAQQHDQSPWTSAQQDDAPELFGRGYFGTLGVVRRKPSRPDAPPTLSKSCSDKLALKQYTSVLSAVTSLLVHPKNAYLRTLVMPRSQLVTEACERAFGPNGRMASLHSASSGPFAYRPFTVRPTSREFSFSRRIADSSNATSIVPSNIASLTYGAKQETLINGVLQGRKQTDPRGASAVSRRSMWSAALRIATLIANPAVIAALTTATYARVKESALLHDRDTAKSTARDGPLQGWKRNTGDDQWSSATA